MKQKKQENFLTEFTRVRHSIEKGTTPVYSELRSAKTMLFELLPSLIIQSVLLVISTYIISQLAMSEIVQLVILLVINSTTQTLSFVFMTLLKHWLRVLKLKKYHLEVTEKNIAVLESMEYQSV